MSDASCVRAADHRDHSAADCPDHRVRASRAGPDAPDRYKWDGLVPGLRGEQSAYQGAGRLAQEHLAWRAGELTEPPYLHAAELRAGQRVGPLNSAWPEDATGHRRMPCLLPQFAEAVGRILESVLA